MGVKDAMRHFPPRFLRAARIFGFGQKRCINCFSPFFADDETDFYPSPLLCPQCRRDFLPYRDTKCALCGFPLNEGQPLPDKTGKNAVICPDCQKQPPPWDAIAFYGLYGDELRELILRFKFEKQINLGMLFADFLLYASACLPGADMIASVPQYPANLLKRGFNQAHELCRHLSRKTAIPTVPGALERTRCTVAQENLTGEKRRVNLKNAFAASLKPQHSHIWLVDDVMTTGSTLAECSLALKRAGAKTVSLLFLARTPF